MGTITAEKFGHLTILAVGCFFWHAVTGVANAAPFPLSALTDGSVWKDPAFLNEFRPEKPATRLAHKAWPEQTEIFGLQPHSITGRFVGVELQALTLLFLDSGTHFGYVPRDKARETELANRDSFKALYQRVESEIRKGVSQLAGNGGAPLPIGSEPMLKQEITLFRTGNLFARLHAIDEQLVKVTFYPAESPARNWIDPAEFEPRPRERQEGFEKLVRREPNGDVVLDDIPLLPQGDRAYCGVSALAMGMQYLGLNLDTEDYAAAAGIRYGSTKGSQIREVYDAAGTEAGFRMSRATKFDFGKAKDSIDAGIPVLVWRRWNQERDYLHTLFASKFAKDPTAELPEPNLNDREMWPDKQSFTHASVITGYNDKRGEVIFSESWSEHVRNRRMRWQEMEGTAYYTFLFRL